MKQLQITLKPVIESFVDKHFEVIINDKQLGFIIQDNRDHYKRFAYFELGNAEKYLFRSWSIFRVIEFLEKYYKERI